MRTETVRIREMPPYTVITENDESEWEDRTGVLYHYPCRYQSILVPGTVLLYYKGKLKKPEYADKRLSRKPHYFGIAVAGPSWADPKSAKQDLFLQIIDYQPFQSAVLAKQGTAYLETIPAGRETNYWRDGARKIDQQVFLKVKGMAVLLPPKQEPEPLNDSCQGMPHALESAEEGHKTQRYVTQYERDPNLRKAAIALHGVTCMVCGFNFAEVYGKLGEGFTHVHHRKPVSDLSGPTLVNPATDLASVCANCHAMIHRRQGKTLTIEQLRQAVITMKEKHTVAT